MGLLCKYEVIWIIRGRPLLTHALRSSRTGALLPSTVLLRAPIRLEGCRGRQNEESSARPPESDHGRRNKENESFTAGRLSDPQQELAQHQLLAVLLFGSAQPGERNSADDHDEPLFGR